MVITSSILVMIDVDATDHRYVISITRLESVERVRKAVLWIRPPEFPVDLVVGIVEIVVPPGVGPNVYDSDNIIKIMR